MIGRSNAVSGGRIERKDDVRVSGATISIPLFPYNGETIMLKREIPEVWESPAILPMEINSAVANVIGVVPYMGVVAKTASPERRLLL